VSESNHRSRLINTKSSGAALYGNDQTAPALLLKNSWTVLNSPLVANLKALAPKSSPKFVPNK
jgi:hypothetical protein